MVTDRDRLSPRRQKALSGIANSRAVELFNKVRTIGVVRVRSLGDYIMSYDDE